MHAGNSPRHADVIRARYPVNMALITGKIIVPATRLTVVAGAGEGTFHFDADSVVVSTSSWAAGGQGSIPSYGVI